MDKLKRMKITIQNRLNEARNNHTNVARVMSSTLSEMLEVVNQDIKKKYPETINKTIEELDALYQAMHDNQCYACSYEFIEVERKFGTEILAGAIGRLIMMQKEINELKTAQAEVVRCRDCRFYNTSECPCMETGDPYYDYTPDDDWFCGDGKRKEGGGT